MARLAAQEKVLFYPTPASQVQLIASNIAPARAGSIFDPCCGDGEPLAMLGTRLNLTTYGNELHPGRYTQAKSKIHNCTNGAREFLDVSGQFNVIFNNPPYDQSITGQRMETQHINADCDLLVRGGLGIWIVPETIIDWQFCSNLVTKLSQIKIRRFTMPEFEQFKQVVIFGIRRGKNDNIANSYLKTNHLEETIKNGAPPLQAGEFQYTFYEHETVISMRVKYPEAAETLALAYDQGVHTLPQWETLFEKPMSNVASFQPVLRLTHGHMALAIAAGVVDGMETTIEGQPYIIKGSTSKHVTVIDESDEDRTKIRERESFVQTISGLNLNTGALLQYNNREHPKSFANFLTAHQDELVKSVDNTYPPLFQPDRDMPRWEPILTGIHAPGKLPGQDVENGLLPAQQIRAAALAEKLQTSKAVILVGEMGSGKAQPLDAKVLTPTGWTTMGEIKVNDLVVNPAGGTARVTGVYPQGVKEIYRVTFTDGSSTECCAEHLWEVNTPLRKWKKRPARVKSLQEIMDEELTLSNPGNKRHFIPMVSPVEFKQKDLLLAPYLLGCLLGDGSLNGGTPSISSADQELLNEVERLLPEGVYLSHDTAYDYRISTKSRRCDIPNRLTCALRTYKLWGTGSDNKFIPKDYLFASVKTRVALLQGLMDTDGSVGDVAGAEFVSVSKQLALDVQFLVQSLGGKAKLSEKKTTYTYNGKKQNGKLAYRLYISLEINPFRLSRKAKAYNIPSKYLPTRAIESITPVGQKPAQCIMLNSKNHLYVTDDFIVTHNTAMSQAIAGMIGEGNWKLVVVCPTQVAAKWKREAEKVLREFNVKGHVIGEKRKQNNGQGKISKCSKPVLDVQRAMEEDNPSILIMSYETAKNGARWEHAVAWKWIKTVYTEEVEEYNGYGRYPTIKEIERVFKGKVACCPECGYILPGYIQEAKKLGKSQRSCHKCGAQLWQRVPFKYGGRVAIADFLNRKYSGQFNLIIDEAHKTKGADTDAGYASQDLVSAANKVIAMTGTLYAGKASSIFSLMYRMFAWFRELYGYNEVQRFVEHHGLQEEITTAKESSGYSSSYGYTRENTRVREIPGVSPGMVMMLLNNTAFIRLSDMGISMPSYIEERYPIPLDNRLEDGIKDLDKIREEAISLSREGNPSLMSAWLYAALGWPDCPISEELEARLEGEVINSFGISGYLSGRDEILTEPLGKDEALLEIIEAELSQDRGVGVYFSQVNRRDWMTRIQAMLKAKGIYSEILRQETCKPEDREEWYQDFVWRCRAKKQEPVLLANGNLVKEGLDLIELPTLVETGVEYRINDLRQRDRRSWRLIQDRPVRVIFLYYEDTFQELALQLVSEKLKAAMVVDGNLAEGLAAMNVNDGNLIDVLMKMVHNTRKNEAPKWNGHMHVATFQKQEKPKIKTPKPEPVVVATRRVAVGSGAQQLGFF